MNERPGQELALVVGAGGLAMAIARRLGASYRLLLADRDGDHLHRQVTAMQAEGHDIHGVVCDVTEAEAVARMASAAAEWGPAKAVVHVVGLFPSMADGPAILRTNLVGPALVADAFGPTAGVGMVAVFIASLGGHLVEVSSPVMSVLSDPLAPRFIDQVVAAVEFKERAGNIEGRGRYVKSASTELEMSIESGRDAGGPLVPYLSATSLAQLIDPILQIWVGEPRTRNHKLTIQSQPFDHIDIARRQKKRRRQPQVAFHRRLRRVDGEPQNVLQTTAIHRYIERHRASDSLAPLNHATFGYQFSVEEGRIYLVELGISIGAINHRMVTRMQRHGQPRANSELRRVGFAKYVNPIQSPAESALG